MQRCSAAGFGALTAIHSYPAGRLCGDLPQKPMDVRMLLTMTMLFCSGIGSY